MPQYEYSVSLRVIHPELKASEISDYLSMKPSKSYDVGSERKAKNGRPLGGLYKESLWSRDLSLGKKIDAEEKEFDEFIAEQNFLFLEYKDFFKKVRATGGEVEYFVGWRRYAP